MPRPRRGAGRIRKARTGQTVFQIGDIGVSHVKRKRLRLGHDAAPLVERDEGAFPKRSCQISWRRCALRRYIARSASANALAPSECGPENSDARGDAGRNRVAFEGETKAVDVLLKCRRLGVGIGFAEIPQQQRKLVAAEPPDHVGGTDLLRQHGDDRFQHLVSCRVAEIVVDRFEPINVEHDQRATGLIALDIGDGAAEFAFETAPIGNPEQEIRLGRRLQRLDACIGLGDLHFEPADFGLCITTSAGGRVTGAARRTSACRCRRALAPFRSSRGARPGFFLHRFSSRRGFRLRKPPVTRLNLNPTGQFCAKKTCSFAPRQDSPLSIPCQPGFDHCSSRPALPNRGPIL